MTQKKNKSMFVHVRDKGNPNDTVPFPDSNELQDLSQAE